MAVHKPVVLVNGWRNGSLYFPYWIRSRHNNFVIVVYCDDRTAGRRFDPEKALCGRWCLGRTRPEWRWWSPVQKIQPFVLGPDQSSLALSVDVPFGQ